MSDKILNTKEVSEILGIHPNTVRIMVMEGRIKSFKTKGNSGRYRYKEEDINEFLNGSWKPGVERLDYKHLVGALKTHEKAETAIISYTIAESWLKIAVKKEEDMAKVYDLAGEIIVQQDKIEEILNPTGEMPNHNEGTLYYRVTTGKAEETAQLESLKRDLDEMQEKKEAVPFSKAKEWLEIAIMTESNLWVMTDMLHEMIDKMKKLTNIKG